MAGIGDVAVAQVTRAALWDSDPVNLDRVHYNAIHIDKPQE